MADNEKVELTTDVRMLLTASMVMVAANATNGMVMDAVQHLHRNLNQGDPHAKELEAALTALGEAGNALNRLAGEIIEEMGQIVHNEDIHAPRADEIHVVKITGGEVEGDTDGIPPHIKLLLAQLAGGLKEI